jgi:hypothetical protein
MIRGGKAALLTATIALGGCTASSETAFKVRPIGDRVAALARGDELAVARGQLALNNVGLALEAFRKAQRVQPSDPAPLVGIADCYSAMGRYDLAQSSFEAALALAPHNSMLLLGLARVYELEGQADRAADTRREAQSHVIAPAASQASAEPRLLPQASITIALPPARPAQARIAAATPAAQPAPQPRIELAQLSSTMAKTAASAPLADPPLLAKTAATAPAPVALQAAAPQPVLGPSTVIAKQPAALPPPARPAPLPKAAVEVAALLLSQPQSVRLSQSLRAMEPASAPALPSGPRNRNSARELLAAIPSGPRLQRLSSGEVALVTSAPARSGIEARDLPVQIAARSGAAVTPVLAAAVHWTPLSHAGDVPTVMVLNAARTHGLAASARTLLTDRGWRSVGVGNASTTRVSSVVLYSRGHSRLARSLAAQFGIRARLVSGIKVVVVLGRDRAGTVRSVRQA